MAKTIRSEDLVLNIIVNGDQGQAEIEKLERAEKDLIAANKELKRQQQELEKAGKTGTQQWKDAEAAIRKNNEQIETARVRLANLRKGLDLTNMSLRDLERERKRLTQLMRTAAPDTENFARYRAELEKVNARMAELRVNAQSAGNALSSTTGGLQQFAGRLTAAVAGFTVIRKGFDIFKEFQYTMSQVQAVSGATADQFRRLKENAELLGETTEYTAAEVGELQLAFSRLGFTPQEILDVTGAVLDLATATGSDLAQAADVAGFTLRAFQLDATESKRVVDVMAASFNSSALQLDYFADSMKYVAPIASSVGVSLEQTTALLGVLADNGIRGSQAGTALRQIFIEMAASGRPLAETLIELSERGLEVGDAVDEVGKRAASALTVLVNNTDAVDHLTAAFERSAGAGKAAADIVRDNVQGDLDILRSKLESIAIWLGDFLNPAIRATIQLFTWLLTPIQVVGVALAAFFLTLKTGNGIVQSYQNIKKALNALKATSLSLTKAETAATIRQQLAETNATAAIKAYAAAKLLLAGNFRAAAAAARLFFASMGPAGLLAVVIGGLVGTLAAFSLASDKAADAGARLALELARERNTHEDLKKAVENSTEGSRERAEAIRLINERYGEYLPNLLTERDSTEEVAKALEEATLQMEANIKARIRAQEMEAILQEQYNTEKKVLQNLIRVYTKLGDRTEHQIANATFQFAQLIEKLKQTGDSTEFLEGAARLFGLTLEDLNRITYSGNQILIPYGKQQNAVYLALNRVKSAAEAASEAISILNAIAGAAGDNSAQQGRIEATKEEIKVDNRYLAVLKRLKEEKKELENRRNEIDVTDTAALEKINRQIAAKKAEIDKLEDKNQKQRTKKNNQWTLEKDAEFLNARLELRRQLHSREIATEEEHARRLLALEIEALQRRLDAQKDKGNDRLKIEQQLADKQYQQHKTEQTRLQKLLEVTLSGRSAADQEQAAYEKRLKELGLFNRKRSQMTLQELGALLTLERQHHERLSKLYVDELAKEIGTQQKSLERRATQIKLQQNEELAAAQTFEQKLALLRQFYSEEELRQVKNSQQADKLLRKNYTQQAREELREHWSNLLTKYEQMVNEASSTGLFENGVKATEEDIARINEIIDDLRKKLAELGEDVAPKLDPKRPTDILGMSTETWDRLFMNMDKTQEELEKTEDKLEKNRILLEDIGNMASSLGVAYSAVSAVFTAMEQRELKSFERTQNEKKKALEQQLKSGRISQERYNEAIQQLDDETAAKREDIERKQAKRDKAAAIFQSLIQTYRAITAALPNVPLAWAVGAIGALQTAAIAATPLPGYEIGGPLTVERQQDGRKFRARYRPDQRGPVDRPTVLVGENGTEYVVPAEAYANPTIRPILDIMERARQAGNIGTLNLPAALAQAHTLSGRAQGGYVAPRTSESSSDTDTRPIDITGTLTRLTQAVDRLEQRLDKPFPAYITLLGPTGLQAQMDRYYQQQKRAGIGG